jgi:ABC-2 type transport system ATP-binding protein
VELSGVGHWYRHDVLFRDVCLRADTGEIIAVRGANGSGKTTLLRVCAGLLRPREGVVQRPGSVGYLPHTGDAPVPRMPISVWVNAMARMRGESPEPSRRLLGELGMTDHRLHLATLSRGSLTKVMFAVAAGCSPSLLVLDEPFAALDDDAREAVGHTVRAVAASGWIVLLSGHDAASQALAGRWIELSGGAVSEVGEQVLTVDLSSARWLLVLRDRAGRTRQVVARAQDRDRLLGQALFRGDEVLRVEELS